MPVQQRLEEPLSGSEQTRQRIIEAALQIFSEHGYSAATTRIIAAAANVNEVTLFRHFGNKQNLLAAVIDQYSSVPGLMALLEGQLTGDYRQDLIHVVQRVLDALTRGREIVQLIICEAQRQPKLQELAVRISRQACQVLERYLHQQIERGLVRPLDAKVAAQVFFGMLFTYVAAREILGDPVPDLIASQMLATQCVDIFVQGTLKREEDEGKLRGG